MEAASFPSRHTTTYMIPAVSTERGRCGAAALPNRARASRAAYLEARSELHVDVMEDVCCPANRSAMSNPVIWLSLLTVPSLYFISTNTCRRHHNKRGAKRGIRKSVKALITDI